MTSMPGVKINCCKCGVYIRTGSPIYRSLDPDFREEIRKAYDSEECDECSGANKVTASDFKFIAPDSHILKEFVPGYSVEKDGKIYLTNKALKKFPELRLEDCGGCMREYGN